MPDPSLTVTPEAPPRPKRHRHVLVIVAIVVALGLAAVGSVFAAGSSSASVRTPDDHAPRFDAGAVLPYALPDGVRIPYGAQYVSPTAAPGGRGTADDPLSSVHDALARIKGSGTIVLRGGTYHESV